MRYKKLVRELYDIGYLFKDGIHFLMIFDKDHFIIKEDFTRDLEAILKKLSNNAIEKILFIHEKFLPDAIGFAQMYKVILNKTTSLWYVKRKSIYSFDVDIEEYIQRYRNEINRNGLVIILYGQGHESEILNKIKEV